MSDLDPQVADLYARLGNVVAGLPEVPKDQIADTGSYSYSYADVNSILRMLKPALAVEGLALMQPSVPAGGDGDRMMIQTLIVNTENGVSVSFSGPTFPVKGDPQAQGSAITYYRRYSLVSLFALGANDDDGRQAAVYDATPDERSGAESEIRAILADLDADVRKEFVADFKQEFGSGLADLPRSRHGSALQFTKWWVSPKEPAEA